ncbi:MAG: GNAT family N-acetyltransferase [Pseudolysinimonas sp.]
MITIRTARTDERLDLIELQRRASLANPGDRAAMEAHPEAVDTPAEQFEAGQVTVAEIDGAVLGFAALIPRDDGNLELDALFTEPAAWRQGIARALVQHGADRARADGISAIHVIGNPHAAEFYLAVGFVPIGPADTEFGPATAYELRLG